MYIFDQQRAYMLEADKMYRFRKLKYLVSCNCLTKWTDCTDWSTLFLFDKMHKLGKLRDPSSFCQNAQIAQIEGACIILTKCTKNRGFNIISGATSLKFSVTPWKFQSRPPKRKEQGLQLEFYPFRKSIFGTKLNISDIWNVFNKRNGSEIVSNHARSMHSLQLKNHVMYARR